MKWKLLLKIKLLEVLLFIATPVYGATPQELAAQVPANVKTAISESVRASNSPSAAANDKAGGFHEEGGIWITTRAGTIVPVPAKPGQAADPTTMTGAHMVLGAAADPSLLADIARVEGEWHVHPSGTILRDGRWYFFNMPPSANDIRAAIGPISLVVGAADQKVYFYDTTGIIGSIKLKDFLK